MKPIWKLKLPNLFRNYQTLINCMHSLFVISSFVTFSTSILLFMMFDAISFTQFSEASMFYMVSYMHMSFYSISIWKRSKILNFMTDLERIIEKSISNRRKLNWRVIELKTQFIFISGYGNANNESIYSRESRSSDVLSKYLWNSMVIFAELFIFPSTIVSYYKYYVLHLADRSFQLSFPVQ